MTTVSFKDMAARAAEAGFAPSETVAPGTYDLELKANAFKDEKKPGIYISGKIISAGPDSGKVVDLGGASMGGDVKPGAISIAFQNISAILGPDDLASLSAQFNDAIPPAAVAQAVAGRTVRAELGHNVYQGQIKGNQVLPGRITLLTKPPLPAAGGVPVIAAAAPVVATDGTPPSDPPPPAAPAVPAPGAVAAPVVEAPAAAPVPVAETAAPAQPTVEELQAQLAALQAAGTGEAVPAPATAAGTPIPVADPSF